MPTTTAVLALLLAGLGLIPAQAVARACLPLAPLKVTLSGSLESAPAAAADAGAQSLRLITPVCVEASAGARHEDVRRLSLQLDPALAVHLHHDAAGRVRLTGTLSDADGPPLTLQVEAIDGD